MSPDRPDLLARRAAAALMILFIGSAATAAAAESAEVTCVATGYAVVIFNAGDEAIAEGTDISWVVPFVRRSGTLTVGEALEPGMSIHLSSALGSNFVDRERACDASLD